MPFDAFDVALDMIRRLREPLAAITERDPALAQQLRRAAASVPLNLSEGRRRQGRDRLHLWRVAAGSASPHGGQVHRHERSIAIAHPGHRDALSAEARRRFGTW